MNFNLGAKSIFWFGLSVLFLILMTLYDSTLSRLSIQAQRVISLLLLVLPGVVGIAYGILSITRKEAKSWVAAIGILLNALFTLFQLFVISFAG